MLSSPIDLRGSEPPVAVFYLPPASIASAIDLIQNKILALSFPNDPVCVCTEETDT